MHLSVRHAQSLEEGNAPVNPDQSPADMLMLSFTDSDLACMAEAYNSPLPNRGRSGVGVPQGSNPLSSKNAPLPASPIRGEETPLLRLKSLAGLTHPLSVDLYIEQVASHARVIVVRLLGGHEWWRYGAEELGQIAREKNIALIMVPGDGRVDARLAALSTVSPDIVAAIDACMAHGGVENAQQVLHCMAQLASGNMTLPVAMPVPAGMTYTLPCRGRVGVGADVAPSLPNHAPLLTSSLMGEGFVIILFYRAHYLAADTAPIDALLEALAQRGLAARAFMATSLRDAASLRALRAELAARRPDLILDATAFAAGADGKPHPLAEYGVPILQCALANTTQEAWMQSPRGLGASDLAMHVVLPESDGRVFTRAISFKSPGTRDAATEFSRVTHRSEPDRIAYVAELCTVWVHLAKKTPAQRRVALVMSDYPGRFGRCAYAVGLDAPQSAQFILQLLKDHGYALSETVDAATLLSRMTHAKQRYPLAVYRARFDTLPPQNRQALIAMWGRPENDPFFKDGAFHLPCALLGNIAVALQPDRGSKLDHKSGYHNAATPPRHGYLAFYWWLRDHFAMDALIHLGTHGNLEWLPGKAVALTSACWPEIALGATPVIYPYIVSDPGEAAQAKRRIGAVTLSHLTPPLNPVALTPELAALEALVDEFSSADGLDARRMRLLREDIVHRARSCGLPGGNADDGSLMAALETHLCDIKEQRVGDGLHVFGQSPPDNNYDCGTNEARNLLAALDGQFIMPGPGGSPVRGRLDIFPTGRNMVTIDPRAIPTPTAASIGRRAAEEFMRRYAQDQGDWPQRVVIDMWGSATLRNGGDEIAQALWLMGIEPLWDQASHRVSGFTILPASNMAWPRVDVSLRISGLFRDMFESLITLFDDASRAVAALDEDEAINPLAAAARRGEAAWRIFGNAPGDYGTGVSDLLDSGRWTERAQLGEAYLQASQFAYGRHAHGEPELKALQARIAGADALVHVQDIRETDVLSGADFADAEGGFAAAAQALGNAPALYHLDTSQPHIVKARTMAEEISLTLQARAINPDWIAGQMRHGYAGGAALADAADQLFAFAATTDAVASTQFDALFDAYLLREEVREFLARENPDALKALAVKLDEAIRRGLWSPLRNSAWPLLDSLIGHQSVEAV